MERGRGRERAGGRGERGLLPTPPSILLSLLQTLIYEIAGMKEDCFRIQLLNRNRTTLQLKLVLKIKIWSLSEESKSCK